MAVREILSSAKGQFIVFVAVAFVLLGLFVGLAIDLGRAYLLRARLSGIVDAAALAAAKVLKGQEGLQDEAAKAACDSMIMNGMQVQYDEGNGTCTSSGGTDFTLSVNFEPKPVPGGPDIQFVQIAGSAPLNTTFMRLAKFITGNTLSSIEVGAFAEGGPERPVDLMLVLDRSGSMDAPDGTGTPKITSLKLAVNEFLNNNFAEADQVGMVSFATRGCGGVNGIDSTATNCIPDEDLGTSIVNLQSAIDGLCNGGANCQGGTNPMEALRTARGSVEAAINDPARATTRKAILLVTDGQPTFMRRSNDLECRQNPSNNDPLPFPGNVNGPFPDGCVHGVPTWDIDNQRDYMLRRTLDTSCWEQIPGSANCLGSLDNSIDAPVLYRDVIGSTRVAAMNEANTIRGLGGDSVVIFAIAIGQPEPDNPQGSLDDNARCLLARIANDPNTVFNCDNIFRTNVDGDTHDDLRIPGAVCADNPSDCINTSQQQGRVFTVDLNGNVQSQLKTIFGEIAALLKLRLTI